MKFNLRPYHVARVLGVLFLLPVIYIFAIEGVETTTEYSVSYSTGSSDVDTSSNLGSQVGKALPWLIFALIFGAAEWWSRQNDVDWPAPVQEKLANVGLAPPVRDVDQDQ